ncbi:hypothetical protein SBA4_480009 [Candidatus Sulfopaludibacter sp. SbA4]|nr:hypothetical protein SBA4_480009 [Candidatus Sulfopaludibacter sp. SbA4]
MLPLRDTNAVLQWMRTMNQTVQPWMPAILALFGSLMVVVITAWLNTKALSAQIDAVRAEIKALRVELHVEMNALRAEMKQQIAEAELRITREILELKSRVERLEEQRLIRQP